MFRAGEAYRAILDGTAEPGLYRRALGDLSRHLHRATGERVIILVDENDEPIRTGFVHGHAREVLEAGVQGEREGFAQRAPRAQSNPAGARASLASMGGLGRRGSSSCCPCSPHRLPVLDISQFIKSRFALFARPFLRELTSGKATGRTAAISAVITSSPSRTSPASSKSSVPTCMLADWIGS